MGHTYTHLDIEDGEFVAQCNDCGAYVLYLPEEGCSSIEAEGRVKHHPTCQPGDAEKWAAFYEEADDEEDDDDDGVSNDWESWL